MNHDGAARHLSSTDQRFADLIARSRRYEVNRLRGLRPFDAPGESIAYQQLSGKAAATMGRVHPLYGKKKSRDLRKCSTRPLEKLRGAGLSHSKTAAIFGWTSEVFNLRSSL